LNLQIKDLRVNLNDRSYSIHIGQNLLQTELLLPHIKGDQVCIVTNQTVATLYLDALIANFAHLQCDAVILPDGETYKTLETIGSIVDSLIKKGHRRDTTLVALGGGVVGDMTGFVASCYQRGVNFIQVPTTLLGQVDASVGGKTAVNHPRGKNMMGSFYQPKTVLIDINTLKSLPPREFRCGVAEMIKAALISDDDFFCWLETHMPQLLDQDPVSLSHGISQACAVKIKLVIADERDNAMRALLNFGHTFGHALELLFNYEGWLHGEAVAVGMILALEYSRRIGYLDSKTVERVRNILTMVNLPIRLPSSITAQQLINGMSTDKKTDLSGLRLVLLKGIGRAVLSSHIDLEVLEETITDNIAGRDHR
jgi:3-dehydroquinate synthase